jgi:hypothetical protein
MIVFQLFLLALLLAGCSIGPGLFFVRWLRWKPAETLCASVAGSLILIYLGSLAIYFLDLPGDMHWLLNGVLLLMTFLCRKDLFRLFRSRQARRIVQAFGFLWIYTFLWMLVIRDYGGGTWGGDWLEHFQRSSFFLSHGDLHYRFLGLYLLTDRPPMMNLIGADYMGMLGTRFEIYELTAGFLNLLPILPCCLFASSLARRGRERSGAIAVLIVLLAVNPMFVQNVTYVWTKSFAAFFALLGLWLYLRGWAKRDHSRIVACFFTLAAGCLVHFYVVGWSAIIFLHYLIRIWPGRLNRWRELGTIILLGSVLMMSWFGWEIYAYGPKTPFTSTQVVNDPKAHGLSARGERIGHNLVATFVPIFLRHVDYSSLEQTDHWGWVRDIAFYHYQTNAIFALGSMGAILLIRAIAIRAIPWDRWNAGVRWFWIFFLPCSALLTLCTVPTTEDWGEAQLAMQPHILLGVAVLSGVMGKLGKPWKILALVGGLIDFLFGVFLHIHLENRIFELTATGKDLFQVSTSGSALSYAAQYNYFSKEFVGLQFIGDLLPAAAPFIEITACVLMIYLMRRAAQFLRPVVQ